MKNKHYALIFSVLIPFSAHADVQIDDLNRFYLSECGPEHGVTVQPQEGPVFPRVLSPSDAATWLPNRAWDVRPIEPCKSVMKPAVKKASSPKQVKKVPGIPQK